MTKPKPADRHSQARRLRPPGLRSLFAVAALAAAGCVEEPVTSPDAIPDPSFARASAPGQQRLAGVDAEFARIARDAPGFGGMFYGPDGRLNVYLTDDGRSPVAQRRILDRVSASLRAQEREVPSAADVTIRQAARDYVELTSLRSRISPVLHEPGVAFLDIDETQNRLTVGVLEGTDAAQVQAVVERLGVPLEAVSIRTTEPIKPLNTLRDAHDPVAGGLQIWWFDPPSTAWLCTLGFNVRFTNPSKSQHYFFTNSHCTEERGTVTGTEFRQDALVLPSRIVAVEVEDPPFFTCQYAGYQCRWSDAALAEYLPGIDAQLGMIYRTTFLGTSSPGSIVLDDGKHFRIAKEQPFPLGGEVVDKVGRTTGWTRGQVVLTCVDTGVADAPVLTVMLCQDWVAGISAGGDSGSPVFQQIGVADESKPVSLYGLLWGGGGGIFVFSAMENIRFEFGDFRVH